MPRFFVEQVSGDRFFITGGDAKHISGALRLKPGDQVIVCDKNEIEHYCTIVKLGEEVELQVSASARCENEPDVQVTLYQALPKGDKFELIVQKAVELGVARVVPMLSSRCISRPDEKSMAKKRARYQKIAEQAAKQCGRGTVPQIGGLVDFNEATACAAQSDAGVIFYELGGENIGELVCEKTKKIAIIIGSEGGFSESEIKIALENGVKPASLGKRILRCETAPLAALSIIMYLTGNM